jgi:hypothetical protein
MEEFDFCCLNLAAGYYRYHTKYEYVIVDDVQNGYDLGVKLVEILGENKYVRPEKTYGDNWGSGGRNTGKSTSRNDYSPVHQPQSGPQVLTEVTEEEEIRMDNLQLISLNDWTDSSHEDDDSDWGDIFYS